MHAPFMFLIEGCSSGSSEENRRKLHFSDSTPGFKDACDEAEETRAMTLRAMTFYFYFYLSLLFH